MRFYLGGDALLLWTKCVVNFGKSCLLQMRSTLLPGQPWDVMVDLFFYREPEETKEPGEEDAADYGVGDQGYGALPAPGGKLPYLSFAASHIMLSCHMYACQAFRLSVHLTQVTMVSIYSIKIQVFQYFQSVFVTVCTT